MQNKKPNDERNHHLVQPVGDGPGFLRIAAISPSAKNMHAELFNHIATSIVLEVMSLMFRTAHSRLPAHGNISATHAFHSVHSKILNQEIADLDSPSCRNTERKMLYCPTPPRVHSSVEQRETVRAKHCFVSKWSCL